MRNEDLRAEIDSIDNELLRLLNRRARLAVGPAAAAADEHGAGARRAAAREGDILERACRVNAGPLDELAVAKIFRRIIHETQHAATTTHSPTLRHWHSADPTHEEAGELV
jgi:chorismate mutase